VIHLLFLSSTSTFIVQALPSRTAFTRPRARTLAAVFLTWLTLSCDSGWSITDEAELSSTAAVRVLLASPSPKTGQRSSAGIAGILC
jgi:hypothetical protein